MRILSVILFVNMFSLSTYAQSYRETSVNAESNARMENLLSSAERYKWLSVKLNSVLLQIDNEIAGGGMSEETLRDMTRRLVKIYYSLSDTMTSGANKKRIINIVGADNSPEAHKFYIEVLSDTRGEYRDMALRSISPKGIHGDDLYGKIKVLEDAKAFSKSQSLMYLKLANPERALKEIHAFLRGTQNLDDFAMVGFNMSVAYDDPNAMDVVFDRYLEFRSKPGGERASGAVEWEMLKKYLRVSEGDKFEKAMQMFEDQNILVKDVRVMLFEKLGSKNSVTRKVSADYLLKQVGRPSMPKEELLRVFESAHSKESNAEIRRKLGLGMETLRKQGGRK